MSETGGQNAQGSSTGPQKSEKQNQINVQDRGFFDTILEDMSEMPRWKKLLFRQKVNDLILDFYAEQEASDEAAASVVKKRRRSDNEIQVVDFRLKRPKQDPICNANCQSCNQQCNANNKQKLEKAQYSLKQEQIEDSTQQHQQHDNPKKPHGHQVSEKAPIDDPPKAKITSIVEASDVGQELAMKMTNALAAALASAMKSATTAVAVAEGAPTTSAQGTTETSAPEEVDKKPKMRHPQIVDLNLGSNEVINLD